MGSDRGDVSAAPAGVEAIGMPARTIKRENNEGNGLEAIINRGDRGTKMSEDLDQ
jgi:hypothetical protein